MISRRNLVRFAGLAAIAFAGFPAVADPLFKSFTPLLIDLPGWSGDKPDGVSMDMGDTKMTTASRTYHKGDSRLEASVIVGAAAQGALQSLNLGMNIETSEGHMLKADLNGFKALKSFNTKDKSGAILIALGDQAMFNVSYGKLSEDEAVGLAQKFDWKALQGLAAGK